jgi:hypothetical protein
MLAASAAAAFAAIVLVLGGTALSPSYLFRHPGPGVLTATAVLAWWGALTV